MKETEEFNHMNNYAKYKQTNNIYQIRDCQDEFKNKKSKLQFAMYKGCIFNLKT